MKFLLDCQKAGLRIFFVPREVAALRSQDSTWFQGFDQKFFYNRGATTRYILGYPLAVAYGIYYIIRKRPLYRETITPRGAMKALLRGIHENKITKQARES